MQTFHNVLMFLQWAFMSGGILAFIPVLLLVSPEAGLLTLLVGLTAMVSLKLEAVAFSRPR